MRKKYFIPLIDKYLSNSASGSEQQLVEMYLERLENDTNVLPAGDNAEREMRIWNNVTAVTGVAFTDKPSVHRVHFLRKWWWAAASIVFVFSIGAYLFLNRPINPK